MLWYLASLASKLNLDLDEVAAENLAKLEERWPAADDGRGQTRLFSGSARDYDRAFPADEQLPGLLRVDLIEEQTPEGPKRLVLRCDGERVGDPLTDNSHIDDGYRYHDAFHFGCAAMLGWSPVVRRILKCKRKSVPRVDVVEDGARALVTEEGVSAVVFGHARDYSMFAASTSVDYGLLRTVRDMVRPFEVRTRPPADWERTILESFAVWRRLIEHRGGTLIVDVEHRRLGFEPPSW